MSWILLLTGLSAVGVVSALILMGMRQGWATTRTATAPGAGWWVLSVVAVCAWGFAIAQGLQANAKLATATELALLKPVTAAQVIKDPALQDRPVLIQDVAQCAEPIADAPGALAVRAKLSGEDEAEGEETDYMVTVDYGTENDVAMFTLGADKTAQVRVNTDALTVLPKSPAERKTIETAEFSPVVNRNLMEIEERQVIACDGPVSVTGIVFKEGEFYMLEPLPKALSILTDRPWDAIMLTAQGQAKTQQASFLVWLVMAAFFGCAQLAMALMARGKA